MFLADFRGWNRGFPQKKLKILINGYSFSAKISGKIRENLREIFV
jgi:hypothetical protein